MPLRTRPTEVPRRPAPRYQRTPSSESDLLRHRPNTDRSPRLLTDRRSPRGSQSDPLGQKKLGTRISDLETQLVQAQRELKSLKQQLSSVEAAKKEAQDELHKKTKKNPSKTDQIEHQGKQCCQEENSKDTHKETDVFEVPMQEVSIESKPELENKPTLDEMDSKNNEIEQLKAKLEEKEKEQESTFQENEILKKERNEATAETSAARNKEEEMALKCTQLEKDLEASKASKFELMEKLEDVKAAKEELEAEMKKLRVQTEQWRKAADAAAAVLAGKHVNGVFEPPPVSGGPGFLGSPGADDMDDGFGGRRKGSAGIRMLGDLWKKKGQK